MGRMRQSGGRRAARDDDPYENERFNPFITHAFLNALETSKSIGPRTGWTSTHILVKDAEAAGSPPPRPPI